MKWIPVLHTSASVQKYALADGVANKVELKYHEDQQSIRIGSEKQQRLFFIERAGLWNNKIIFKNEYGVEVGKLSLAYSYSGHIELEHRKYHYIIRHTPSPELVLYENSPSNPLAVCDLPSADEQTTVSRQLKDAGSEYACLLLALFWYLFPATVREKMEYVISI
jgi:hypothetical protein